MTVAHLNRMLPRDDFRAYAIVHLGMEVEADVAQFAAESSFKEANGAGGVAVQPYAPPAAAISIPIEYPDEFAVHVREIRDSSRLVAVMEIVSEGNKKEVSERQAFAAKCAAHLQLGIGLVVADVVTSRRANLHDTLIRHMGEADKYLFPPDTPIYVAAYRPVRRADRNLIDFWPMPLTIGQPLPAVPLALKGFTTIALDLEATYVDALRNSNLD
jgi:hypothetical protein